MDTLYIKNVIFFKQLLYVRILVNDEAKKVKISIVNKVRFSAICKSYLKTVNCSIINTIRYADDTGGWKIVRSREIYIIICSSMQRILSTTNA